ncbi:large ribosomal subunit protein mL38-like isoform X2 [Macrobrachium rosenbergii]
MLNRDNNWTTTIVLLLLLALLSQCQLHHHHRHQNPESHQIVPLSTHPISPGVDRKATQGLAAVQRFRQILRIHENQQETNRFPQSFPDLPASRLNPPGRSKAGGIPEISRVQTSTAASSLDHGKGSSHTAKILATSVSLAVPGTGNSFPGSGKNVPGSGNNFPGSGKNVPGSENNFPGSGKNVPGSGINGTSITPTQTNFFNKGHQTVPNQFFAPGIDVQEGLRTPEAPRVPDIPSHLPLDLANRLQEFPSLAASFEQATVPASLHSFFEPTQKVEAEELTDEEWQQYLASEWGNHQVIPSLLDAPPTFVANVNYGDHQCLHLGNVLTPAQAKHRPKSFEFPGEVDRQYAVMLLDMDQRTGIYITWLAINVPVNQLNKGMEIMEYEQPRPGQGEGSHRMVFLVYLQRALLPPQLPTLPSAKACETTNRERVNLDQLTRDLGLKGPTAGNYFLTEWDVTVEHACS